MDAQTKADGMAARYIALRDFKAKLKAENDEKMGKVDAAMEKVEGEMMTFLNQTGQESANTKSGTFFKKTTTKSKVADRDVFLQFVIDGGHINFLTNHVSADAVTQYLEEHGALPPGVNVDRVTTVSVNRPKQR
jgi:hypothetical protein